MPREQQRPAIGISVVLFILVWLLAADATRCVNFLNAGTSMGGEKMSSSTIPWI